MKHLLGRLWRFAAALALPVLTAALLLYFGRPDYQPSDVGAVGPPLEVETPAPLQEWRLRFLNADGTPAAQAVVLAHQPDARYAEADAEGYVRLLLPPGSALAFYAHAPGMDTLSWGPEPEPPGGPVRFSPLPESAGAEEGAVRKPAEVVVRTPDHDPLAGALVLARRVGRPTEPPWIGIADGDGKASFLGLPAAPLRLEVYAPGMPPVPAMLLGEQRVDPTAGGPLTVAVEAAWLTLEGLPPDAMTGLLRDGFEDALPRQMVPLDGILQLGPLPPGDYRLDVEGAARDLLLQAGRHTSR